MRRWFLSGIRTRLILLVLCAVVPALGLMLYSAQEQRRAIAVEGQQNALRLARIVSASQDELIEGAHQLLIALAQIPAVQSGDSLACGEFLRRLLDQYPRYANFGMADPEGNPLCSGLPMKGPVNIADRAYFKGARERHEFAIGDYQIGRVTGKATINFGYPVWENGQRLRGVVFAALDLAWLNRVASRTHLPEGATVTLVDRHGTVLVRHPDPGGWVGQKLPENRRPEVMTTGQSEGTFEGLGLDKITRLNGFVMLGRGTGDATVIVGIPKDLAFAAADRILARSLIGLAVIALLALAAAWWGGDWLVIRKLKKLFEATRRVAGGDLSARVGPLSDQRELQLLGGAFDRMAEALESRAIEAKKAEQQIQRQFDRINALREINSAATATLDLQAVLSVLLEKIKALLPYTAVLIWLRDEASGQLQRAGCWNLDESEWKGRKLDGTPILVQTAVDTQKPVVVANIQHDPRTLDRDFYRRHELVSYLGIPLVVKSEVLGVLVFLTKREHRFADEEIEFLSTLAGQAAIAIDNSLLYGQTKKQAVALQKANEDLSRKEQIQRLLKELSQDITKLDVDSLLKKLTEKVREFFAADLSDVRILKEGQWSMLGVSGVDPGLVPQIRAGSSNRRSRWIVENKKPLVVPDTSDVPSHPSGGSMRHLGLRGYLGVPLLSRHGEVLGVLRALTYQRREFTQEEVDLLQLMANGAAVAVENALLLEQTKQQAAELEKANKVKDEFLGFVSHELKSPVNLIRGYAEFVRSGMAGDLKAEQAQALDKVLKGSGELTAMINGLLEATKIEVGGVQLARRKTDLKEFLDELRSDCQVPMDKGLDFFWNYDASLPVITTDGEKLRHILQNLIDNATKYTDQGSVTITARHVAEDARVEFSVADTGVGITSEALPHIFEMFRQVNGCLTRSRGGVGLGLHIVRSFSQLLGGEIRVESRLGEGSTFTLILPAGD